MRLNYLDGLKKHWTILIVILLGLTPVLWLKPGYIIANGDYFPVWFNSLDTIHRDIFSWESTNGGQVSLWPTHIIYESIWYVLQWFSVQVDVIQIISHIFFFVGAGISMYYLALTIYKGQKITALLSSIFYMFNFFMLFTKLNPATSWMLVFLPLWIALYIKVVERLKTNRSTMKYSILFILNSMILLSFSAQNPPLLIISGLSIGIIFLYYLIFNKGLRLRLITNLIALIAICLATNLWWLILLWMTYQPSNVSILSTWGTTGDIVSAISYYHNRASFLNLFWMNGIWSWTEEYYSYIHVYDNFLLSVITFIPMTLAFVGLLFKNNKYRRLNCYLAFIVLLSLFLQKGVHEPLTNVNSWLYENIPGSIAFREPSKFGFLSLVPLALLIGSSADSIFEVILKNKSKFSKWLSYIFVAAVIIVFLYSTFPLLTGEVFGEGTEQLPFPAHVKFPDYWYQASSWINSQDGDFRVLLTPEDDFYAMPFDWGYYGSDTFAPRLVNNPVLQQVYGYTTDKPYSDLIAELYNATEENRPMEFRYLVNLLNVHYILQRNDIPPSTGRAITPPSTIKTFLHSQAGITQIKTFGELDLYEVPSENSYPHIYTATVPIFINGSIDEMLKAVTHSDFPSGTFAIFLSEQLDAERMQFIKNYNDTVELTYTEKTFNISVIDACYGPFGGSGTTTPWLLTHSACYKPFSWYDETVPWSNFSEGKFAARSYLGMKAVVMTNGGETNDTLSFPSPNATPYEFPNYSLGIWNAYNSTLIFIKTDEPLDINAIYADGNRVDLEVKGVWWETGYAGMGKAINYPVTIPKNQRAIIQIGKIAKNVSLSLLEMNNVSLLSEQVNTTPQVVFQEINPTEYKVHIKNANKPFFLVFSENYNPNWKVYISNDSFEGEVLENYKNADVQELKQKDEFISFDDLLRILETPIPEKNHFITNGYANAWYIDKNGDYTLTIQFEPQISFNYALLLPAAFLIAFLIYISYGRLRNKWSL